jgi:hypothetical protein
MQGVQQADPSESAGVRLIALNTRCSAAASEARKSTSITSRRSINNPDKRARNSVAFTKAIGFLCSRANAAAHSASAIASSSPYAAISRPLIRICSIAFATAGVDPGNPANPLNRINPNNPFNPINEVNPNNPLNPINRYNPDTPFQPLR